MNLYRLEDIKPLFFDKNTVAGVFHITPASAGVLCTRYVKKGIFLRLKRNLYILKTRFLNLSDKEKYRIANILQVPSYISLTTALAYYSATTQAQQDYIESVVIYRSAEIKTGHILFSYVKLQRKYYNNFRRIDNIFIASPEKALADSIYLASFGKYNLDFAALDLSKINLKQFNNIIKKYPSRTCEYWGKLNA